MGAQVEQTKVEARNGSSVLAAARPRSGDQSGRHPAVVRFDGEDQTVSARPHLVRVLLAETEMSPLSVKHIIEQLGGLLP
jgi:hypothetical protein